MTTKLRHRVATTWSSGLVWSILLSSPVLPPVPTSTLRMSVCTQAGTVGLLSTYLSLTQGLIFLRYDLPEAFSLPLGA